MSPLTTFQSVGSSSRLVERRKDPKRRHSFRVGYEAAFGIGLEHGPELDELEDLLVLAGALLSEKHGRPELCGGSQGEHALERS